MILIEKTEVIGFEQFPTTESCRGRYIYLDSNNKMWHPNCVKCEHFWMLPKMKGEKIHET